MMLWVSFLVGVGFTALAAWLLVRQLVSKQQQAHAFALLEAQQDTQATLQQLRHELETRTQKAAEARTLCDTYEQRLQASQIQLVEATTEKVRLTERLEQLVSLTTEKENLALALNQSQNSASRSQCNHRSTYRAERQFAQAAHRSRKPLEISVGQRFSAVFN